MNLIKYFCVSNFQLVHDNCNLFIELTTGFHRNLSILDSIQWISDSKAKHLLDSGFRIPYSFTPGELECLVPIFDHISPYLVNFY